jgi:hypothetical protein
MSVLPTLQLVFTVAHLYFKPASTPHTFSAAFSQLNLKLNVLFFATVSTSNAAILASPFR